MYRRIELIAHQPVDEADRKIEHIKGGIMTTPSEMEVIEAWIDMPGPRKSIPKNGRFYFTEKGWDKYGRAVIKACQKTGQEYRVIRIKENAVEVLYKDDIQVMARPLRKRS